MISSPVQMTSFPAVESVPDAFSGATPLAAMKFAESPISVDYANMFLGLTPGSLGEVSAVLLILGGLYLLVRKVISWHIPVAVLGTMALFSLFFALGSGYGGATLYEFPLFHILAGGALLGAIFMATDHSTPPMTHQWILASGGGARALTMWIVFWVA